MKINNCFVGIEVRCMEQEARDFFVISVDDLEVGSDNFGGVDGSFSRSKKMLFGFDLRRLDYIFPSTFV